MKEKIAHYHLPGLFEFYEFYKRFLPLYFSNREYFYSWCDIGSIYGAPYDTIWNGGRVEGESAKASDVYSLMNKYGISCRLTFSNSLLAKENLQDKRCNDICKLFNNQNNGVIIYSDLLLNYLKEKYSSFYYVSSTTKVLTSFDDFINELNKEEFKYVVPDFRLNKEMEKLNSLSQKQKDKVEFLCNECCPITCKERGECYQNVSARNLGLPVQEHLCKSPNARLGYRFSSAMENPSFISKNDIKNIYLTMGFSNFKIEGRGLGSALLLEFILYYMVKEEYQIKVREEIYLDNMLDLF